MFKDKTIGIVGLGGLGGYVAQEVARLNPKKIIIIDGDTFQESNLNRQLFSNKETLKKKKALITKNNLELINNVVIEAYDEYLTESNLDLLNDCDLVFDCLDNIKTRLILSSYLSNINIPLIHGAISSFYGEVCLCLPNRDILKEIYKDKKEEKQETNSYSVALIASFEVALAYKYFQNDYDDLKNKLILLDLNDLTIKKLLI